MGIVQPVSRQLASRAPVAYQADTSRVFDESETGVLWQDASCTSPNASLPLFGTGTRDVTIPQDDVQGLRCLAKVVKNVSMAAAQDCGVDERKQNDDHNDSFCGLGISEAAQRAHHAAGERPVKAAVTGDVFKPKRSKSF